MHKRKLVEAILQDNHFLAMNGICNQLNISYEENIAMSNRVFKYFFGE